MEYDERRCFLSRSIISLDRETRLPKPSGIDPYTVMLLHCDGTQGSTNFIDAIGRNSVYEVTGAPPYIDNVGGWVTGEAPKFGTGAIAFPFNGGITWNDSNDFDFGDQPFTIDFWLKSCETQTDLSFLFYQGSDATNIKLTYLVDYTTFMFQVISGWTTIVQISGSPGINYFPNGDPPYRWGHVAIIRGWGGDIGTWAITVDGAVVATATEKTGTCPNIDGVVHMGSKEGTQNKFNGWIDEFRISKGIARWTSDFSGSLPTEPYTP